MERTSEDIGPQTLDESWRKLAPIVDNAFAYRQAAAKSPELYSEPEVLAHLNWLMIFNSDLGAVQTIFEYQRSGRRVPTEWLAEAKTTADALYDAISNALERVSG